MTRLSPWMLLFCVCVCVCMSLPPGPVIWQIIKIETHFVLLPPERFLHKPVISDELKNTTVAEGDQATLVCRVTSELHPHFFWVKHYQVNGSYEDENGTAYYRRVNPIQVSIRTKIATPCGMLHSSICPLSLCLPSPFIFFIFLNFFLHFIPFRKLSNVRFHWSIYLELKRKKTKKLSVPKLTMCHPSIRHSAKSCSNPPLDVSDPLHPLTLIF